MANEVATINQATVVKATKRLSEKKLRKPRLDEAKMVGKNPGAEKTLL